MFRKRQLDNPSRRGSRVIIVSRARLHSFTMTWLLRFALFLSLLLAKRAQSQCTLCTGGTSFNVSGTIGSLTCSQVAAVINSTAPSSPICYQTQLKGYLWCSCASFPTSFFCSMCANGVSNISNPDLQIPSLNNATCQESLFANQTDRSQCEAIANAATECGCTAATLSPTLAPNVPTSKAPVVAMPPSTTSGPALTPSRPTPAVPTSSGIVVAARNKMFGVVLGLFVACLL